MFVDPKWNERDDPVPAWVELLQAFAQLFEEAGLMLQGLSDEQLMRDVAGLMTGVVLAWTTFSYSGNCFPARGITS